MDVTVLEAVFNKLNSYAAPSTHYAVMEGDEKYPLVYVVPSGVTPYQNVTIFNLEIYCFDIIQRKEI